MRRPVTKAKPAPTRAAAPVTARPRFPVWLMAVLLVLVALALYWPATGHDFINYDDDVYVLDNPHVTSGLTWANARWALGSGYATNWHPVTWLSHMLDCQLFGLKPWGHHLTSVLLHALNAMLVFMLLQQIEEQSRKNRDTPQGRAIRPRQPPAPPTPVVSLIAAPGLHRLRQRIAHVSRDAEALQANRAGVAELAQRLEEGRHIE